jgi:uncharacterized protein YbaP (TraB family)
MRGRMRNRLYLICLIVFIIGTFSKAQKNNFMWEIKSDSATVYLLGSAHVAKEDLYPLDSAIENAFERSKYLAVELDINSVDPQLLLDKIQFKDSTNLEDVLNPELYDRLKKEFNKYMVPSSMFKFYKPWFAVLYLGQLQLMKEGYDPESGIDKYFLDRVGEASEDGADNKIIIALETAEDQLAIFDEFDKMPNEFVEYSLNDMDSTVYRMEKMFEAWLVGDTASINEDIIDDFQSESGFEDITKLLIDDRNMVMAERIMEFLTTGETYFVVVGAAHIPGDNGILSILRRENTYLIEQR